MLGLIEKSADVIYEWSLSDDKKIDDLSAEEKVQQNTIEKLTTILSGEKSIYCHLQFLIRNDKTDMLILKQTKDAVRVSVCHYATVVANGFMHCGTTHDSFLRLVQTLRSYKKSLSSLFTEPPFHLLKSIHFLKQCLHLIKFRGTFS